MHQKISILLPLLAAFILLSSCEDATAEEEKSPEIVYLHPEFTMTIEDLEEMTTSQPEAIRQAILAKPQDFLELVLKVSEEPEILTILVDKNHALPEEWEPEDRVSLNDYPLAVSRKDLSLSKAVMPHVLALNDAAKADGVTLLFSSTFRSWTYQQGLYQRYVKADGQEAADRYSARPGHSQHQLGTVIDFGSITEAFADTKAGKWMKENAWKYGFSLSFPEGEEAVTGYMWEPWHFRYIGPDTMALQRDFFGDSQQRTLEFLHDNKAQIEAFRVQK